MSTRDGRAVVFQTRFVLGAFLIMLVMALCPAWSQAATIYIGDAAVQGMALTRETGSRADTVTNLTYEATHPASLYTAPSAKQIKITQVNFYADMGGTLRPFVATYNGASNQLGSSYKVIAIGDSIAVTPAGVLGNDATDHLVNTQFLVGGVNPVLNINAGDVLSAGWQQQGNIVYITGTGSAVPMYIANGLSIPGSVGSNLTMDSTWGFNFRTMEFNVGFELVQPEDIPEPATLALLSLGATGVGGYVRRRTRK